MSNNFSNFSKNTGFSSADGYYILESYTVNETPSGSKHSKLTLVGKTGRHQAFFGGVPAFLENDCSNRIVYVTGYFGEYFNKPQIKISSIRLADEEEAKFADLIPSAPLDTDEAYAILCAFVYGMKDQTCRDLCRAVLERFEDDIRTLPGGKSIHHAYVGGLLMHIVCMLRTAAQICDIYNNIPGRDKLFDRDLLFCGIILHDIGKKDAFILGNTGLVKDYSNEGRFVGHSVLGYEEIKSIAEALRLDEARTELITHMIISHHSGTGKSAAASPRIPEAHLLSMLDQMDAKLEVFATALQNVEVGSMSSPVPTLDDHRLYKHPIK